MKKEAVGTKTLMRGLAQAKILSGTAKGRQRLYEHTGKIGKTIREGANKRVDSNLLHPPSENKFLAQAKNSTKNRAYLDTVTPMAFQKASSVEKLAVGNLGEEELNFLKHVRLTREDTRADANALFSVAHQTRARDRQLLEKLFVQTPGALTMGHNLLKEASAEQLETFEKISVAYNVYHFFEAGAHLDSAQRRFPELVKAAKAHPTVALKKTTPLSSSTGDTNAGRAVSGTNA